MYPDSLPSRLPLINHVGRASLTQPSWFRLPLLYRYHLPGVFHLLGGADPALRILTDMTAILLDVASSQSFILPIDTIWWWCIQSLPPPPTDTTWCYLQPIPRLPVYPHPFLSTSSTVSVHYEEEAAPVYIHLIFYIVPWHVGGIRIMADITLMSWGASMPMVFEWGNRRPSEWWRGQALPRPDQWLMRDCHLHYIVGDWSFYLVICICRLLFIDNNLNNKFLTWHLLLLRRPTPDYNSPPLTSAPTSPDT